MMFGIRHDRTAQQLVLRLGNRLMRQGDGDAGRADGEGRDRQFDTPSSP